MTKNKYQILVIDDDKDILLSLEVFLQQYFKLVICCSKPDSALQQIQKHDFDVILLDMNFAARRTTGNEGFFWMDKIKSLQADIPIVFITAYADIELAVKAVKTGAFDFIEKPWKNKKLLETLLNAVEQSEGKHNKSSRKTKDSKSDLIVKGFSENMCSVWNTVSKAAPSNANILILGENGTGKEIIANEIHAQSLRNKEAFIKVDLGAIPHTLFESELFGYMRGAFTDARENKPGRFELASGGTLFLDEIANLPLNVQSKLLSVLQNRELYRLGDNKPVPIDVRIVAATNRSLEEMIEKHEFREDLYYRLNTITIDVPALRDRKEDIPLLANAFLEKQKLIHNKPLLKISEKALRSISDYPWPGNIRQLENCIEKAVILCEDSLITEKDFQLNSKKTETQLVSDNYYDNELLTVRNAITKAKGNLTLAAANLGIARTTLYRKMKKYDLQ